MKLNGDKSNNNLHNILIYRWRKKYKLRVINNNI